MQVVIIQLPIMSRQPDKRNYRIFQHSFVFHFRCYGVDWGYFDDFHVGSDL